MTYPEMITNYDVLLDSLNLLKRLKLEKSLTPNMKRKIDRETNSDEPTSALICCVEDDYKNILFIDSRAKSTERFIITNEGAIESIVQDDGGYELVDILEQLRKSYLSDDHRTTMVRSDIHNFDRMMHTIFVILEDRLKAVDEVYLNITGASGEFCTAASILAMCYERVHVVSVKRNKTAMTDKEIEDNPGLKVTFSESVCMGQISGFDIEPPKLNLIRALKVYNETPRGQRTSSEIIKGLLNDGIWYELKRIDRPTDGKTGTSLSIEKPKQKTDDEKRIVYREKNFYQRNILGEWIKYRWVKEDEIAVGGYDMDDEGRRVLSIFTGSIANLDSYILIDDEKEQQKIVERDQKRIELMKTLLDKDDGDRKNE